MLLDAVGENRLPNFQNVDFHVERPITFMNAHLVPSLDIFNVTNINTIQALQRQQNAAQREPDQRGRRAARAPLRHPGELVDIRSGGEKGPGLLGDSAFFCSLQAPATVAALRLPWFSRNQR